jgi:pyridoxine 5-phosphate synthase
LDAVGSLEALKATTQRLKDAGIEVSLFLDPELRQIDAAKKIGAQFIELHTGAYAEHFHQKRERNLELDRLVAASNHAHAQGLLVNAGHGLNLENLPLLHIVPHMIELNIGHSLISRALEVGLATAVKDMLRAMENYPG